MLLVNYLQNDIFMFNCPKVLSKTTEW